nr:1-deoxy-D-xylulose-5-phosphate reductoisomerase [candidate division Zixibacteria bacterium]
MKKRLVILGSTGSIGRSALDVASRHTDRIEIVGLSVHANIDLLAEQIRRFHPKYVAVTEPRAYDKLARSFNYPETRLLDFSEGIRFLTGLPEADVILNAIVGAAGLKASLDIVHSGKRLALANKESMVIGGELINRVASKSRAEIVPVDSEHSAIWQALCSGRKREVKKIILTGSGGPFRDLPLDKFKDITREQALHHPTWNMGPKITIDSATMMNKGLEIIEAMRLFDIPAEKIEVVIHPQSIIHSMVEFVDSSIIAQMSNPDMRLPIAYAIFFPERLPSANGRLDLMAAGKLEFYPPDYQKFPLLKLAFDVAARGGTVPAVYNAANEIAVEAFLNSAVEFVKIPEIVINTVNKHEPIKNPSLDDILEADRWARDTAIKQVG